LWRSKRSGCEKEYHIATKETKQSLSLSFLISDVDVLVQETSHAMPYIAQR